MHSGSIYACVYYTEFFPLHLHFLKLKAVVHFLFLISNFIKSQNRVAQVHGQYTGGNSKTRTEISSTLFLEMDVGKAQHRLEWSFSMPTISLLWCLDLIMQYFANKAYSVQASKEELRKDRATQKMKLEGQDSFSVKIGKIYYKCVNLLIGIGVSVEVSE